jgi:hypothetical protein
VNRQLAARNSTDLAVRVCLVTPWQLIVHQVVRSIPALTAQDQALAARSGQKLYRSCTKSFTRLEPISDDRLALVTVIVTKTPRNEPDVVRRVEATRCRRLSPAWVCATGRDGLGRGSACASPTGRAGRVAPPGVESPGRLGASHSMSSCKWRVAYSGDLAWGWRLCLTGCWWT